MSDHQESRPTDRIEEIEYAALLGGVTVAELEETIARVCEAFRNAAWSIGDGWIDRPEP